MCTFSSLMYKNMGKLNPVSAVCVPHCIISCCFPSQHYMSNHGVVDSVISCGVFVMSSVRLVPRDQLVLSSSVGLVLHNSSCHTLVGFVAEVYCYGCYGVTWVATTTMLEIRYTIITKWSPCGQISF